MKYSIDTSAILDAWLRYYPPDVFPALWLKLDELIDNGTLQATEEVLSELERKDDDVYAWAAERDALFIPIDDDIQPIVSEILKDYPKLLDTRLNRSAGDPFVIALAKLEGCTVVTGEHPTGTMDRPNIPDVCAALGIRCISVLDMIREEGWRFER